MSLVEKCWMVTSKISVIALLMITGIYFGKFVCPYIKKKKGAVVILQIGMTAVILPRKNECNLCCNLFFLNQIAACIFYIEAVVPFLSFFSYRSFCHNRVSPFDIRQSELMKCFLRVSIS